MSLYLSELYNWYSEITKIYSLLSHCSSINSSLEMPHVCAIYIHILLTLFTYRVRFIWPRAQGSKRVKQILPELQLQLQLLLREER